jgi:hypothetical protein
MKENPIFIIFLQNATPTGPRRQDGRETGRQITNECVPGEKDTWSRDMTFAAPKPFKVKYAFLDASDRRARARSRSRARPPRVLCVNVVTSPCQGGITQYLKGRTKWYQNRAWN